VQEACDQFGAALAALLRNAARDTSEVCTLARREVEGRLVDLEDGAKYSRSLWEQRDIGLGILVEACEDIMKWLADHPWTTTTTGYWPAIRDKHEVLERHVGLLQDLQTKLKSAPVRSRLPEVNVKYLPEVPGHSAKIQVCKGAGGFVVVGKRQSVEGNSIEGRVTLYEGAAKRALRSGFRRLLSKNAPKVRPTLLVSGPFDDSDRGIFEYSIPGYSFRFLGSA
jgi:hypothetical protein